MRGLVVFLLMFTSPAWSEVLGSAQELAHEIRQQNSNRVGSQRRIEELVAEHQREPGFVPVGASRPHEFESARKIARLLYQRFGLTLVLFSQLNERDVPAYDAVLLSPRLQPLANVSLKADQRPRVLQLYHVSKKAFFTMDQFAKASKWAEGTKGHPGWKLRTPTWEKPWTIDEEWIYTDFQRMHRDTVFLAGLFGAEQKRRQWLITDILDESHLSDRDFEALALDTRDREDRTHLILTPTRLITLHGGGIHIEPLRVDAPGCEEALRTQN